MKKQRSPLLSTRQDWISVEIFTLYVSTIIYAIIVWQYQSGKTQETMEAVFVTMRHVSAAILPMVVVIVGTFEIIGEIMIRLTSLIVKMRAEGKAEGFAEGKAEAIAEFRRYFAWERRREKAAANNQPFDEPPPPKPEG
ncbi:hypothetical protein F4Z99_06440, partial [Candidatus Poribacteria bacterium]|nr:hypothetical protein [Candidatus Poribacteria bacterium]